jgi:protein-ribulosamine 3-kinase
MLSAALRTAIEDAIARATGQRCVIDKATSAAGGCIHSSWVIESRISRFFVKVNELGAAANFVAEADGLAALGNAGMRVPHPVAQGSGGASAFLVLEFLALKEGRAEGYRELGRQLARLHGHRGHEFGWYCDNFIGTTPQRNKVTTSWAEFWVRERLRPQLELAARNGHGGRLHALGERVIDAVPRLLAGHTAAPSLLHGDLWGGNAGFLAHDTPVVFDPAVYYGDGEADLAMTELFGGFPVSFYEGYRALRPVDEGYRTRRILYNLYHVLNHLNLFGAGYLGQCERMMESLLIED